MTTLQLVHILKNEFYHYYFENDDGVKKSLLQIADKIEELMYGKMKDERISDFKEVYAIARNRNSTAQRERLTVSVINTNTGQKHK